MERVVPGAHASAHAAGFDGRVVKTWAKMPRVRMRGRYLKDATTAKAASGEAPCSKDFSKRAKFTAGIFTLVCPHGKTAFLFSR